MSLHYSQTGYPDGTQVDCLSTLQIYTILKPAGGKVAVMVNLSNLQIFTILKPSSAPCFLQAEISNLQIYTILKPLAHRGPEPAGSK